MKIAYISTVIGNFPEKILEQGNTIHLLFIFDVRLPEKFRRSNWFLSVINMKHKKPIHSRIQTNFALELAPESEAKIISQKKGRFSENVHIYNYSSNW